MKNGNKIFKTGIGYDMHRLASGLTLHLGGITVPHSMGCVAHSDGDALIHAICDALLGAVCMGDIGVLFPDTDERYKNIDSKVLLKEVVARLHKSGYSVGNVDCVIMLQQPKIRQYVPQMQEVLAAIMQIPKECVSVKATTTEGLGSIGRCEGIGAQAVATVVGSED